MDTIEILTVILLISASALCVALIYYIYQIVKSVHSISAEIQGLSYRLNPLIESTFVLSGKLTHITDVAESQLQISKSIVSDIRDRADKILNIESKIRNQVEDTVMPIVKNINAVGIGVGAFWRKLRNK
ncbi:MAG: hypothetical protein U5J96_15970 [Ignavibacteriaceae bacterium]|nr:hypothetical protein [Ignavibacteriaceae bacterium]